MPEASITVEHDDKTVQVYAPEALVRSIATAGPSQNWMVFTQATPATQWVVNHNLGYRPLVQVLDTMGNIAIVNVQHTSLNQFTVNPDVPGGLAGSALYG